MRPFRTSAKISGPYATFHFKAFIIIQVLQKLVWFFMSFEIFKTFDSLFSKPIRTFQDPSWPFTTLLDLSRPFRTFQDPLGLFKTLQELSKPFDNIPLCFQTLSHIYWPFTTLLNISRPLVLSRALKSFQDFQVLSICFENIQYLAGDFHTFQEL